MIACLSESAVVRNLSIYLKSMRRKFNTSVVQRSSITNSGWSAPNGRLESEVLITEDGHKKDDILFISSNHAQTLISQPLPKRRKNDPELYKIWCDLYLQYFPQREDLANYQVTWANNKRKRTLASCNLRRLKVTVASELRHEKHYQWLSPLLYHEMCHAVLHFEVGRNGRGMRWHGSEFKELEARHPHIEALNHWAKNGGWLGAIRSDRARRAYQKRLSPKERISHQDWIPLPEKITSTKIQQLTTLTQKVALTSKGPSKLNQTHKIVIKRRNRSRPPATSPSGQFLLFLSNLKRKLIG